MPYICHGCGTESEDPTGWVRIQVTEAYYTSAQPSVGADDAYTVLNFDSDACRQAWKEKTTW